MTEAPIEFVVRMRGGAEAAADAKRIEGAVKKMGGQVTKVGEDSVKAGKKTKAFGSSLKHVALGLGAVGAAFIAYGKAKEAIETTTELARSSVVLSKATGMSVQESSRMTAVSNALGVSNIKLAQVFTKMGAATVKQAEHTGKSKTAFDRLGLSQDFAKKHLNDMGGVLDAVTHGFVANHIPALERTKILTELFGKSWEPLGRLFLDGETNFKHLTGLAKQFGLELSTTGVNGVEKLKEQQEEYTLSTMGLKVAFTKVVAGPLGQVLSGFAKLTVYAREGNWTGFNREVGRIAAQFEVLAEKVLPRVAESFAHIAPAVLRAFWRGFTHASIGGQLLLAGLLFNKFGLTPALFMGRGKTLGKAVAKGVVAEDAEATAAGTSFGSLFGPAFLAAVGGYLAGSWLAKLLPNGILGIPEHNTNEAESTLATGLKPGSKAVVVRGGEVKPGRGFGHTEYGSPEAGSVTGTARPITAEGEARRARLEARNRRIEEHEHRHHGHHPAIAPGHPAMALGGRVMRSGLVEVGERGRELLNLPAGATVRPLTGGGGHERPIIIKIAGKTLARIERRELLEAQAAGA